MGNRNVIFSYFTKGELCLWGGSIALIAISFFAFRQGSYLTLTASMIGVTSLIFCAKGNPLGPFLMIIFGVLYGIISFGFTYYGEVVTYIGMTVPMSIFAVVAWLKNPYNGNQAEVTVNRITRKEAIFMIFLTLAVTVAFYFILKYFHTANLIPSTVSVTTSFLGAYLTFRRSAYFALAYAVNDIILIILWILATITDISYLSVTICFIVFLANDGYGFINWLRMGRRQGETA